MIRDANLTAMSTKWRVFNSEWMVTLVAKIGVEEKEKKGAQGWKLLNNALSVGDGFAESTVSDIGLVPYTQT